MNCARFVLQYAYNQPTSQPRNEEREKERKKWGRYPQECYVVGGKRRRSGWEEEEEEEDGDDDERNRGGVGKEEGLLTDGTAVNAHNIPASTKWTEIPISPMRC